MTRVYDNWERLVTAVLRREDLLETALRTPSDVSPFSSASASPSFNFSANPRQVSSLRSSNLLVGQSFTYNQILEATDFLSDSNLIKHGHSGKLFYGVLEDGTQVVVKKVQFSSLENELRFVSELEVYGMLYHPRLVSLLGHCLEIRYEKFLVYKYAADKDLSSFLRYDSKKSPLLDWTVRLKIAIGAAEGLCYLHHERFPPLVHRDIQASSILLDDDFEVRLGSLSAVCPEEKDNNPSRIARFLRLPKGLEQTTSGTSTARCSYDVYCFGKVLLELITGKLGMSSANDSHMRDWIENTLHSVVSNDKKLVLNIVDNSLIIDEQRLVQVWAVACVAKACVERKPSKRPQMYEIFEAIKSVKSANFGQPQPATNPGKFWPTPTVPAVPEGSKTTGRIPQATRNVDDTSSGAGRIPWATRNVDDTSSGVGRILQATRNVDATSSGVGGIPQATRNVDATSSGVGRIPQATRNVDATSSGSRAASGNCMFSEVTANEKVHPLGETLISPNFPMVVQPQVSTVVLKMRLHCEGCAQKIRGIIRKVDGVVYISIDTEKDLVTVIGTMDIKNLIPYLKDKLKRNVDIVPPKKDDGGGGDKKGIEGGGRDCKDKEGGEGGRGGDKKEHDKEKPEESSGEKGGGNDDTAADGGGGDNGKSIEEEEPKPKVEVNKMEYHPYDNTPYAYYHVPVLYNQHSVYGVNNPTTYNQGGYGYQYHPHGGYESLPPPQMFSDENPNSCSVM